MWFMFFNSSTDTLNLFAIMIRFSPLLTTYLVVSFTLRQIGFFSWLRRPAKNGILLDLDREGLVSLCPPRRLVFLNYFVLLYLWEKFQICYQFPITSRL